MASGPAAAPPPPPRPAGPAAPARPTGAGAPGFGISPASFAGPRSAMSAGVFGRRNTDAWEWMYRRFVSGSKDPPGQLAPPESDGTISTASGPPGTSSAGGVNSGPSRYRFAYSTAW